MKVNTKMIFTVLFGMIILSSCVAKKKYLDEQIANRYLRSDSAVLANKVSDLQGQITILQRQIDELKNKNASLSTDINDKTNTLNQNQQTLAEQQKKLAQLQALLDQQKMKAEELKKKMADALVGFTANELTVTQKNGKVYVSLSEGLLFPSGSAVVNVKGKDALSKLAAVLVLNPDISVDIEGHTDSIPIRGKYEDNWALSTARASSIVRILVNDYKVDPRSVVASGHSMYDPIATNSTPEGRAQNRRTEIILSPKLDELYNLINQK
ncbi:MAG: OmpA family protein [Chitinophagaceae bacterium]